MTDQQMTAIRAMRAAGQSYATIANNLGLSVNTVKSYGRRCGTEAADLPADMNMRFCPNCSTPFQQPAGRKPKRFCSDRCRLKWWHQNKSKLKSAQRKICPGCGAEFAARPEQKYCGHACYIATRFGGGCHEHHAG